MTTKNRNSEDDFDNTVSAAHFMPDSPREFGVLQERSQRYAAHPAEEINREDWVTYISFRLGHEECYGIPYLYAREVMRNTLLTPLPCAAPFVGGIINRRGSLLAVLDLKKFFPVEPAEYDKNSSIIIVTHKNVSLGILADSILGSASYNAKNLDPVMPSEAIQKLEYISGLHDGKIAILNIEKMLTDSELQSSNAGK